MCQNISGVRRWTYVRHTAHLISVTFATQRVHSRVGRVCGHLGNNTSRILCFSPINRPQREASNIVTKQGALMGYSAGMCQWRVLARSACDSCNNNTGSNGQQRFQHQHQQRYDNNTNADNFNTDTDTPTPASTTQHRPYANTWQRGNPVQISNVQQK